jgi:hypothetical protein
MTVLQEKRPEKYNGLSSDEKPTPEHRPEGSTFHAIDTGEKYIVHNGMWERDLSSSNNLNIT